MWRGYCRPNISVFRLFRLAVPYWSWPWPRFHIPLIEPDWRLSRIRLSDKTITPSPTTGRAPAQSGARAQSARRGARVDKSRSCAA